MKRLPILLALIVLHSVLFVTAQDKAGGSAGEKPKDLKTLAIGSVDDLEFPKVDGWTLSEKQTIPDDGGGTGTVVNYDSKSNGRVTVYVYSHGLTSIPNDLGGLVKQELEGAKAAIQIVAQTGFYGEVKEGKTEAVTLGGEKGSVKALKAAFTFRKNGQVLNSDILVFAYQDHFIKLRASRPDTSTGEAYAALLLALDRLFSTPSATKTSAQYHANSVPYIAL